MPNESVKCPNCGSGDIDKLTNDSYSCNQCRTNFHSSAKPTNVNIVKDQKMCSCGRNAIAACIRCGESLCQIHCGDNKYESQEQVDYQVTRFFIDFKNSDSSYKEIMAKYRIPANKDAIICTKCAGECYQALKPFEDSINEENNKKFLKAAKEGQACNKCFASPIAGRCKICGQTFCSDHVFMCDRCHQLICYICCPNPTIRNWEENWKMVCPKCIGWLDKLLEMLGLQKGHR